MKNLCIAILSFAGILEVGIENPNELQGRWYEEQLGVRRDKAVSGANNPILLRDLYPCRHIVRVFSSKLISRPSGHNNNATWIENPGHYKEAAMSAYHNPHGKAVYSEAVQLWIEQYRGCEGQDYDISKMKSDALEEAAMHYWNYQSALKTLYELEFVTPFSIIPETEKTL